MHPGAMKGGSFHKTEKAKFENSLKHQQIGGGHLSDLGVMCGVMPRWHYPWTGAKGMEDAFTGHC